MRIAASRPNHSWFTLMVEAKDFLGNGGVRAIGEEADGASGGDMEGGVAGAATGDRSARDKIDP